jgi:predicted nucleotidyltransferase
MTRQEFNDNLILVDDQEKRLRFVQKFLFHGTPHVFNGRESDYFEFRTKIANKFNVGFHEVFIVGSAKLGFSFYKNSEFDYDSDIDVVIVNEKLFEEFYFKITEYQYKLDRLYRTVNMKELKIYSEFLRYLVKGWMRPDKLPTSFQVNLLKTEWFDFFDSLSSGKSEVGNYKVTAGLFKNYTYLEKYYTRSVEDFSVTLNIE